MPEKGKGKGKGKEKGKDKEAAQRRPKRRPVPDEWIPVPIFIVHDLPEDATEADAAGIFKGVGEVVSTAMLPGRKGAAILRVNKKEGENVEKLIKNVRKDLKAPEVKGKKVQVLESSEKCTIFIGNLPLDLDTAKMRALCEPHGKDPPPARGGRGGRRPRPNPPRPPGSLPRGPLRALAPDGPTKRPTAWPCAWPLTPQFPSDCRLLAA